MEITIKTYDEISTERVKIEVVPGQRAEITIDGALSTATGAPSIVEVANVLGPADRAGRVLVLECRVAELEAALHLKKNRIAELERSLAASLGREQTAERRADENREWAKRAEASLTRASVRLEESRALVTQRDKALDQAADDLAESRKFRAQEREEARRRIAERDATAVRQAKIIAHVKSLVSGFRADQALAAGADPEEHMDVLVRKIKLIRRAVSLDPRAVSLDRTLDAEADETPQA